MSDYYCRDELLWIDDVGGRDVRVILLSLEPGARFWLSLDMDIVQFERLPERACKPVGESVSFWNARLTGDCPAYIEQINFVERPHDAGASGCGFCRKEAA
jgi:hypothetical protein